MNNLQEMAGLIAAGLTLVSAIIYVRAIWNGSSTTRWSSWLIWTFTSASSFATYYGSGARESALVPAVYVVFCIAAFVAAVVRRSSGGLEKIEVVCLIGAAVGGVIWWVTGSAEYGQIASVTSEMIAYIPIMANARGENYTSWLIDVAGGVANLFAITSVTFGLLLYPVAILLCNITVVVLIVLQRRRAIAFKPVDQVI